jgi:hypothetical protein
VFAITNKRSLKKIFAVCAVLTSLALPRASRAQEPEPTPTTPAEPIPAPTPAPAQVADPEPVRRLEELEARERARQEQAVADEKKRAEEKKKGFVVTAAAGKGLTVKAADDSYSVTFRTRAQIRNTFLQGAKGFGTNEINIKTLRFSSYGHVLDPALRYNIQLAFGTNDFEKDNYSPIFDAYVEYAKLRDLNVRLGQYFVPFDRARTTREFALQFVDRQQAVRELTLDRDVGVMLSSSDLFGSKGILAYNLFAGGGEGRNRFGGQKPGPLLVARFTVRPFGSFDDDQEGDLTREARPRLAVGMGGAYNHGTNRQNSTYGTTFVNGTATYYHGAVDMVFKYAGLSVFAEAVARKAGHDAIDGVVNGAPVREYTRSGHGFFAQAGMMLTQHLEVVARWDQIFANNGTDPAFIKLVDTMGKQVGGGFNLYLNGHAFKIQSDYFAIFGDDASELNHLARVQLDATF